MPRKRKNEELPTVDLDGVEILSTGGPVHGVGSPPEGDNWSSDDLRAMADAATELAEELQPPAKIGHAKSGDPAVGYLENIRVNDDGSKLLADVKSVPRKFAGLVKAKAYKARSVELSKVTSQKSGKTYDWAVTGLAWLGAKLPAVRTLDDVVALYEGDGPDAEIRFVVEYEQPSDGTVVWDPADSLQSIRNDLQDALNPGGMDGPNRYWVSDVAAGGTALVSQGYDDKDAWVVPWTRDADGTIRAAPSSDWVKAKQTWVATSKEYAETLERFRRYSGVADEKKYTDEQRRKFAEATGLDADKATDEVLAAAGVPLEQPTPPPEPPKPPEGDETTRVLEERLAKTEERVQVAEKRAFEAERDGLFATAMSEGRFEPGERDSWEVAYEANPVGTRAVIEKLPKNETLAREYGSAEEGEPEGEQTNIERAFEEDLARRLDVKVEELI